MAQDNARPGGDQRQTACAWQATCPWPPGGRTRSMPPSSRADCCWIPRPAGTATPQATAQYCRTGRSARSASQTARLEYQFTVAKKLHWAIGAEWVQQSSSLSLFRLQSHGPYLALRASW